MVMEKEQKKDGWLNKIAVVMKIRWYQSIELGKKST